MPKKPKVEWSEAEFEIVCQTAAKLRIAHPGWPAAKLFNEAQHVAQLPKNRLRPEGVFYPSQPGMAPYLKRLQTILTEQAELPDLLQRRVTTAERERDQARTDLSALQAAGPMVREPSLEETLGRYQTPFSRALILLAEAARELAQGLEAPQDQTAPDATEAPTPRTAPRAVRDTRPKAGVYGLFGEQIDRIRERVHDVAQVVPIGAKPGRDKKGGSRGKAHAGLSLPRVDFVVATTSFASHSDCEKLRNHYGEDFFLQAGAQSAVANRIAQLAPKYATG